MICDSTQSIFSDIFKTSLMINQMECDQCKNLLRHEDRRCSICGDCVERLYSHKICTSCNGRISFQDLKSPSIQPQSNKKHFDELFDSNRKKLCSCPPQNFCSLQPESFSNSALDFQQQKKCANIPFYSDHCIPSTSNSKDDFSSEEEE